MTQAELLAAAEAFLSARYPRVAPPATVWGNGPDRVAIFPEQTPDEDKVDLAAARQWRRIRADAGFGWIDGPETYGGQGLSPEAAKAYAALEAGFAVPSMGVYTVTDGMVIPTTLAYGSEEAKASFLPALVRGDLVACQLFSEPEAGSDLGAVRTRATKDGDRWIVTGQKVWSSGAHLADVGLLLARTGEQGARHQALTMFLVDMRQPGVMVRPLRQMTGGSSFNEVFLDESVIPDGHRLGDVDGGWAVAMTTLRHERAQSGDMDWILMGPVTRLRTLVGKDAGASADPLIRQRVATAYIHARLAELTAARAAARIGAGQPPGPEASVVKLSMTENLRRVSDTVTQILGARLAADSGQWGTYAWAEFVLSAPALRFAGGTDEIQRNTIAERVLGLPRS